MPDDEHVPSGRLKRLSRLAYLTARTTGDLLAAQARRRLSNGPADHDDLRKAGERILATLGELKGAALKLGQALAMDPDALPEEARSVVAKLLSQAPQRMELAQVRDVVIAELGKPPEELFAEFDPEPMAAASLGQVHAARLHDGREVVLKVQYPGVDKALDSDLRNAAVLVRGFALTGETLDGRPYYDELRRSLMRELDYREEAAQCDAWRKAAARYPELVAPEVVYERSSQRVLCLTRLRGKLLIDFIESKPPAPDEERFRVGRLMLFAIWGPFYSARLIHADPHPGNFLVMPDGRLGVLDFGATKRLSPQFATVYRHFVDVNGAGREIPDVGPLLKKAGFRFLGDDEEDGFEFCQRIADVVQRPIVQEIYDFSSEALFWEVKRTFARDTRVALTIKPPAEAILFYRSVAGLAQDLRLMKAKGPFRSVLGEISQRGVTEE
ncbi:MAG TPA: AarF/ABC1/UbiB kinase family protein [Myxococcales bacterium]|nr:AarF/ABC1/UbiB kinase family protein [Myxococcales bacterium]